MVVNMLKKKLGLEVIERDWSYNKKRSVNYFKIPTALIIPESCEWIGKAAFLGCDWLKKVEVPRSVEEIGDWAFWGCKNATITLKKPKKELIVLLLRVAKMLKKRFSFEAIERDWENWKYYYHNFKYHFSSYYFNL